MRADPPDSVGRAHTRPLTRGRAGGVKTYEHLRHVGEDVRDSSAMLPTAMSSAGLTSHVRPLV